MAKAQITIKALVSIQSRSGGKGAVTITRPGECVTLPADQAENLIARGRAEPAAADRKPSTASAGKSSAPLLEQGGEDGEPGKDGGEDGDGSGT